VAAGGLVGTAHKGTLADTMAAPTKMLTCTATLDVFIINTLTRLATESYRLCVTFTAHSYAAERR
jgi:hypothetical protein